MDRETQALWRRYRGSSAPEDRAALYRALVNVRDATRPAAAPPTYQVPR